MSYAENTTVPVERSKAEIEGLLRKHGATQFVSGWDDTTGETTMVCRIADRMIRFTVRAPTPEECRISPQGQRRNEKHAKAAAQREHMRRWRARLLITKAKLEIIATGESTIEREFLADIVLPDKSTVGEWITPRLEEAYDVGKMPTFPLLGSGNV